MYSTVYDRRVVMRLPRSHTMTNMAMRLFDVGSLPLASAELYFQLKQMPLELIASVFHVACHRFCRDLDLFVKYNTRVALEYRRLILNSFLGRSCPNLPGIAGWSSTRIAGCSTHFSLKFGTHSSATSILAKLTPRTLAARLVCPVDTGSHKKTMACASSRFHYRYSGMVD